MASFHGSPLVRNSSTARPGTNVSVVMFNGYDDAGVTAKAKADVQVLILTQAHTGQQATRAQAAGQGVHVWPLLRLHVSSYVTTLTRCVVPGCRSQLRRCAVSSAVSSHAWCPWVCPRATG